MNVLTKLLHKERAPKSCCKFILVSSVAIFWYLFFPGSREPCELVVVSISLSNLNSPLTSPFQKAKFSVDITESVGEMGMGI
jgi:hypothetical protein